MGVFKFKLSQFWIQPRSRMISISKGKNSNSSQLCTYRRIAVSKSFQFSSIAQVFKGLIFSYSIQLGPVYYGITATSESEVIICKINISWIKLWKKQLPISSFEVFIAYGIRVQSILMDCLILKRSEKGPFLKRSSISPLSVHTPVLLDGLFNQVPYERPFIRLVFLKIKNSVFDSLTTFTTQYYR